MSDRIHECSAPSLLLWPTWRASLRLLAPSRASLLRDGHYNVFAAEIASLIGLVLAGAHGREQLRLVATFRRPVHVALSLSSRITVPRSLLLWFLPFALPPRRLHPIPPISQLSLLQGQAVRPLHALSFASDQ